MIIRFISFCGLGWILGFILFVFILPGPADERTTDGIIVLTGGPGRIARGIELLKDKKAKRMLVSGVNRHVAPAELAQEYDVPLRFFRASVDLGQESVDTRSNGAESAEWVRRYKYRTVRLITTDWHMPRAQFELSRHLDRDVEILPDAVRSEPGLVALVKEYNKYLLRRFANLIGI